MHRRYTNKFIRLCIYLSTCQCADINECADHHGNCHEYADCINSVGSYRCVCQTGFTGTGFRCTGSTQTHSHSHFTLPQQPPLYYGHYTCQPALANSSSYELEDFVGAKFYCPHALADGNQHIRIREKTLEFSSTVSSMLSPYLVSHRPSFVSSGSQTCRRAGGETGLTWVVTSTHGDQ